MWFIQTAFHTSGFRFIDFVEVARVVFGLVTGIALWTERQSALTLVKVYFAFAIAVALFIAVPMFARGFRSEILHSKRFTWCIQIIGSVVLWSAYFHSSKRVKYTFGRNL